MLWLCSSILKIYIFVIVDFQYLVVVNMWRVCMCEASVKWRMVASVWIVSCECCCSFPEKLQQHDISFVFILIAYTLI